jgi:predicted glycosyltransferase
VRFLLYSHDGSGLGHIRRNLNIATALVEACPAASVLLATGSESLDSFTLPGSVDVLRLPGLRKVSNDHYAARRLGVGGDEVRELRTAFLRTAVEAFRPDVLVADKHPAGLHGELVPALEVLHGLGGRAALGVRDVLDGPAQAQSTWRDKTLGEVLRHHHMVLVYGQEELLDPLAGSGLAGRAGPEVRYCGYVTAPPVAAPPGPPLSRRRDDRPLVVGCAGGGEDGDALLTTFLAAARGAPWDAVAVAGPDADPCFRPRVESLASAAGAALVASLPELGAKLASADAVVCMGGYNSLVEALTAAVPAVCVPRVTPRTEQLVRARAFAERGLLRLLPPDRLEAGRLRAEIDAALHTDRAELAALVTGTLRLDGRQRAAAALLELAARRAPIAGRCP